MINLRAFSTGDLGQLYEISLLTGFHGKDATNLYQDKALMGHIYSAPYAIHVPDLCFIAEDQNGVAGFVLGTEDTRRFSALLEANWWPALRSKYPIPTGDPVEWSADERRWAMIHQPKTAPEDIVAAYPAHLHLNLHPRMQGKGAGPRLLDHWLTAVRALGQNAVHIGVGAANEDGQGFWGSQGFTKLRETTGNGKIGTVWMGRKLD